ncbi:MAG: competence/damage-inducible protein A [Burkholderiales bacterium]|nr:competence/damage-inducible protein A [Burkholderiales bacterium]
MNFGALIIGDEILRGKRTDRHFAKMVELLAARGLRLAWVEYRGDDREALTAVLRRTFASGDIVFCFGGIGSTPDDHTRQAAAAALGVELVLHPEAACLIEAAMQRRYGRPANAQQLQMGEFPQGAELIPNAYNGIPGFSIRDHHFMPGFPVMAHPMAEWVLDHRYAHLHHSMPERELSIYVYGIPESAATPLMIEVERRYSGVKVFSLPHVGDGGVRRHIELGVRGDPAQVEAAMRMLREGVLALGATYDEHAPARA